MTICFAEAFELNARIAEMDDIANQYTGWSLTEIKKMSVPDRRFWAGVVQYRLAKRRQ